MKGALLIVAVLGACALDLKESEVEQRGSGQCSLYTCEPLSCTPGPNAGGWTCTHSAFSDLGCFLDCGIDRGGAFCPEPGIQRVRDYCTNPCSLTYPSPLDQEYGECVASCISGLTTTCAPGGNQLRGGGGMIGDRRSDVLVPGDANFPVTRTEADRAEAPAAQGADCEPDGIGGPLRCRCWNDTQCNSDGPGPWCVGVDWPDSLGRCMWPTIAL